MDKVKKKKCALRVLLGIVLIVASIITVEMVANINVMMLSADDKGTIVVEDEPEYEGGTYENETFSASGSESSIKWDLDGQYVDKFAVSYSADLWFKADVTIGVVNSFGKEEVKQIIEGNPIELSQSVIDINENVNWIQYTMTSESEEVTISDPVIINDFQFNGHRMLITGSIVLAILLLWWFRGFISSHLEYGFLVLSICMGVGILSCIPANKVSWDEETHFSRAYKLALFPSTEQLSDETAGFLGVTVYNSPLVQPGSSQENEALTADLNDSYETGEKTQTIQGWTCGIYTPGYVFEAIGIKIAKLFGGSFTDILFAGRLASLVSFIVLIFMAIRILPVGKELLLFISSMPTTIFLAVTYNYDIVVFGFIALGLSIIMREWLTKNHQINEKWLLIAIPILAYGCLPKAVYAPLVLLPLLIPANRFKNRKTARLIKSGYILLFLGLMASFVLPQLMGNANNDPRGGAVDSSSQLKLIFTNPLVYAGVFFENVKNTFASYFFGEAQYSVLGHLRSAGFNYLIPMTAGCLILTVAKNDEVATISWKDRLYIFALIVMTVGLVWTALYLAYTVPGSSTIAGVQGRYFKPVLLLFYFILCPFKVQMDISKGTYRMSLLGICLFILSVTAVQVFLPLCI